MMCLILYLVFNKNIIMSNQEQNFVIKYDENGNVIINKDYIEELFSLIPDEEEQGAISSTYCCNYFNIGSRINVNASSTFSASLKCMKHRPLEPVQVSKGGC